MDKISINTPKIGKIKPSRKIIQFTTRYGGFNIIAKEATIEGKYISGLGLDDVIFKLTIYDDTVDFDEISNTNKTDFETRKRYIEDIVDSDTVPYNQLSVYSRYKFISVEKFSNKNVDLYLATEFIKPIDFLKKSIFSKKISEIGLSKLNALVGNNKNTNLDTLILVQEEEINDTDTVDVNQHSYINNVFKKTKELKLEELKTNLESIFTRIGKEKSSLTSLEKTISNLEAEYKLIQSRINNMVIEIIPNGYSFYLSPSIEGKIDIDEDLVKKILAKLPKNINGKEFIKLFEQNKYMLHIEKDGLEISSYSELSNDIKKSLLKNDIVINVFIDDTNKETFHLLSDDNWHNIISNLEKIGFYRDMDLLKKFDPLYTIDSIKNNI